MVTLLWSVKGGSGTTVVASMLAITSAHPCLVVDLDGDVPGTFGVAEPSRPGVREWLLDTGPADQLVDLVDDVDDSTALLPWSASGRAATRRRLPLDIDAVRWTELTDWLTSWTHRHEGAVLIDAGTGPPPATLAAHVDHRWVVTRACYLSLRRAGESVVRPTGVVVVEEPGRQLKRREIEHAWGTPVVLSVAHDPAIARAVDAGLVSTSLPRSTRRALNALRPGGVAA